MIKQKAADNQIGTKTTRRKYSILAITVGPGHPPLSWECCLADSALGS